MQVPETCRGCVMLLLPCFLWELLVEPISVLSHLKAQATTARSKHQWIQNQQKIKGSMHSKRQQKRNLSILEQAEYKSAVGVIQVQKALLLCFTLDYLTNQKAGTKLSLQVLFALVKQTQRLGESMYSLSDRRHTVFLHCLSCETVIDRRRSIKQPLSV